MTLLREAPDLDPALTFSVDLSALIVPWSLGTVTGCEQRSERAWRLQTADGRGYYLKKHFDRQVLAAYPVFQGLAARGIRVEVPLPADDGSVLVERMGCYYALYGELPGDPLDVLGNTAPLHEAHALGVAIGRLHRGLAECTETLAVKLPRAHLLTDTLRWTRSLQSGIERKDAAWLSPVVAELSVALGDLPAGLPCHLVHNDCHSGNIIFDACGIPGFVDFDFMRTNLRIFDPCYCLAGLLVDGLSRHSESTRWIDFMERLLVGYASICSLEVAERDAIAYVTWAALLINAGWWLNADRRDLVDANLRALRWLTSSRS